MGDQTLKLETRDAGAKGGGEERLKEALRRRRKPARTKRPEPYDADWGWWMEQRLDRLESQIKWLIGLAATTLATEVIRVASAAWKLP